MDGTVPLNETAVPLKARGKYRRALFHWSLVLIVIMVQVLAASYLSFYLLRTRLQDTAERLGKMHGDALSPEKCATHWTAAFPDSNETGEDQALAWQNRIGQVFTGNCAEYNATDKSLEIKSDGYYFIYVQVMLKANWTSVKFILIMDGKNEIERNSRTASELNSNTVIFGSTYRLRQGSKILVKSNPKYVRVQETDTFLGLFKL
ncbi:uncharacterized protein LOC122554603 isoform X2 [Chiloscyllium plagiosum]|uniref:uncharacterized protein LOC122554603 isoform X2 n=1 Tax=Chiloscyllium plagiosum TaxID=36176 RepID=UPI001CB7C813|nr:uncharacterized protein LOC122554603 isoform X2 [Chiloscyllium plagiosum]